MANQKNKKLIIGAASLLVLLVFAAVAGLVTFLTSTTEIEIVVAPASATILIDGKEYKNGKERITSGKHNVIIKKDGFNTSEFSFDTADTNKLYAYILENDNGYNWYLNHQDDSMLLTKIGSYINDKEASSYQSKNPISLSLPIIYAHYDEAYNYTEYRIDGGTFTDCKSDFCIKITDTTGGNYEAAIQKIKDTGFNPDDYQILYEYKPIQN